jgi:hypothetical protein
MPKPIYAFAGLDINKSIERLCDIWGAETVLQHLKDWVAYMEQQLATMERYRMLRNDDSWCGYCTPRKLYHPTDHPARIDGEQR